MQLLYHIQKENTMSYKRWHTAEPPRPVSARRKPYFAPPSSSVPLYWWIQNESDIDGDAMRIMLQRIDSLETLLSRNRWRCTGNAFEDTQMMLSVTNEYAHVYLEDAPTTKEQLRHTHRWIARLLSYDELVYALEVMEDVPQQFKPPIEFFMPPSSPITMGPVTLVGGMRHTECQTLMACCAQVVPPLKPGQTEDVLPPGCWIAIDTGNEVGKVRPYKLWYEFNVPGTYDNTDITASNRYQVGTAFMDAAKYVRMHKHIQELLKQVETAFNAAGENKYEQKNRPELRKLVQLVYEYNAPQQPGKCRGNGAPVTEVEWKHFAESYLGKGPRAPLPPPIVLAPPSMPKESYVPPPPLPKHTLTEQLHFTRPDMLNVLAAEAIFSGAEANKVNEIWRPSMSRLIFFVRDYIGMSEWRNQLKELQKQQKYISKLLGITNANLGINTQRGDDLFYVTKERINLLDEMLAEVKRRVIDSQKAYNTAIESEKIGKKDPYNDFTTSVGKIGKAFNQTAPGKEWIRNIYRASTDGPDEIIGVVDTARELYLALGAAEVKYGGDDKYKNDENYVKMWKYHAILNRRGRAALADRVKKEKLDVRALELDAEASQLYIEFGSEKKETPTASPPSGLLPAAPQPSDTQTKKKIPKISPDADDSIPQLPTDTVLSNNDISFIEQNSDKGKAPITPLLAVAMRAKLYNTSQKILGLISNIVAIRNNINTKLNNVNAGLIYDGFDHAGTKNLLSQFIDAYRVAVINLQKGYNTLLLKKNQETFNNLLDQTNNTFENQPVQLRDILNNNVQAITKALNTVNAIDQTLIKAEKTSFMPEDEVAKSDNTLVALYRYYNALANEGLAAEFATKLKERYNILLKTKKDAKLERLKRLAAEEQARQLLLKADLKRQAEEALQIAAGNVISNDEIERKNALFTQGDARKQYFSQVAIRAQLYNASIEKQKIIEQIVGAHNEIKKMLSGTDDYRIYIDLVPFDIIYDGVNYTDILPHLKAVNENYSNKILHLQTLYNNLGATNDTKQFQAYLNEIDKVKQTFDAVKTKNITEMDVKAITADLELAESLVEANKSNVMPPDEDAKAFPVLVTLYKFYTQLNNTGTAHNFAQKILQLYSSTLDEHKRSNALLKAEEEKKEKKKRESDTRLKNLADMITRLKTVIESYNKYENAQDNLLPFIGTLRIVSLETRRFVFDDKNSIYDTIHKSTNLKWFSDICNTLMKHENDYDITTTFSTRVKAILIVLDWFIEYYHTLQTRTTQTKSVAKRTIRAIIKNLYYSKNKQAITDFLNQTVKSRLEAELVSIAELIDDEQHTAVVSARLKRVEQELQELMK